MTIEQIESLGLIFESEKNIDPHNWWVFSITSSVKMSYFLTTKEVIIYDSDCVDKWRFIARGIVVESVDELEWLLSRIALVSSCLDQSSLVQ